MHRRNFETSPRAPAASIVTASKANYRFTLLTDGLLRYEWAADGKFEDRASTFVINRALPTPKFRLTDHGKNRLEIVTARFHLTYSKERFSPSSLSVQVLGNVSDWKSKWRYGETAQNLGGTSRTLDEVDGRMPLEPGVLAKYGFAAIDDSQSMLFDSKGWVAGRMSGERCDGYLFAYGHDFRAAIRDFYAISGPTPLLPRWALGNWWSRFYPYSDKEYLELMDQFTSEGIPLSVAVIDVDWHLIQDERVQSTGASGWTGYTWSDKLFPNPGLFMDELHKRNLRITLNDHPADGIYSFEAQYEEAAKALHHKTTDKDPIPFDISDPAFCDVFFDIVRRSLEEKGNDFWWTDWQQGKYSKIPGLDPLWMLNHFSFLDNSLGGKRALHFSRYAGPGSHRYPIGFSGDTVVSWKTLEFQPEFTNTASNIGYGWWSHDIGGHMEGIRDEELGTRWVQYGVFSPIMRLHSSMGLWCTKEPWNFNAEASRIQTKFMQLRHRLAPYLYTANIRASEGSPLCQPMYWEYPKVEEAYTVPNQYMFGSELLVVPITSPRDARTKKAEVLGWLPPGRYVDIFTETIYDGNRNVKFYRRLEDYPVLARQGAIIPLDGEQIPGNGCLVPRSLEVSVVVGKDGSFEIHEDDGAGAHTMKKRTISIRFSHEDAELVVEASQKVQSLPNIRDWTFRFLACEQPAGISCTVGDQAHGTSVIKSGHGFSVGIQSVPVDSSIRLRFAKQLQLSPRDTRSQLQEAIAAAQIEYLLKNRVWDALDPAYSRVGQIARLQSLPIEAAMLNSLLEILLAED